MATNVEIKARVKNPDSLLARAQELSDAPGELIRQEDTFFHTSQGRLKLRVLEPDRGQLVYYERADTSGPRRSYYVISETADPNSLQTVLAAALGVRGVVHKERLLFQVGQTRVHLDSVEGLGTFMELEVVMRPGQEDAAGQAIAAELMRKLGIAESDLIDVAYIDLLEGMAG
jgi:predicted adenylyl cyclase CyaB